MKLTKLKQASNYEVEEWLIKTLDLTPYQKEKLRLDEIVRFSKFNFYKRRQDCKSSILWRFTLIIFLIYLIAAYAFLPLKMLVTGEWGYSRKFYDNFHAKWMNKLKL